MVTKNRPTNTDFYAGFGLLDRYQDQWTMIHSKTIDNLAGFEQVSSYIKTLETQSQKQLEAFEGLSDCFKSLVTVNEQIDNISRDMSEFEKSLPLIEDMLIELRDLEESAMVKQSMSELDKIFERKSKELRECSMANCERIKLDHCKRVEVYEKRQSEELDERRIILEKTFEEEKMKYLASQQGIKTDLEEDDEEI